MEHRQPFAFPAPSKAARIWIIVVTTLVAGIAVAYLPAIPQAAHYHNFADQRSFFGISNLLNVASNLPFVLGGIAGLRFLLRQSDDIFLPSASNVARTVSLRGDHERIEGKPRKLTVRATFPSFRSVQCANSSEKPSWYVFFAGAILTGIGSAYYHFAPDNTRLVWDRLPMTLVFMSLLAAIISERISAKTGRILLFPLLLLGSGSVLYWYFGEQIGQGDLRLYGFVQFFPILLLPLILLLFPARYTNSKYLMGMIGVYAIAKVSEALDAEIFALGQIVSGHTVKHLIASLPIFFILQMLRSRKKPMAR